MIERAATGSRARVSGAIARALCLQPDRDGVLDALVAPETRIVSTTVTEKGYGLDRATGGADPFHAAIAHDLADPGRPVGVAGLLVWALAQRQAAGVAPFAVLCCDNLPGNGGLLRGLLLDLARRTAPTLVDRIAAEVAFPATMVDRITPAAPEATRAAASGLDPGAYAEALAQKFATPHLKHETYQIAMDGTEKLPQRILAPAAMALERGQDPAPFAFATAAWMRYAMGRTEAGEVFALRDPQAAALTRRLEGTTAPGDIAGALIGLPGLFPEALRGHDGWREAVTGKLDKMLDRGLSGACPGPSRPKRR